jgi:ribosomal protein L11 methyltransferase
LAGFLEVSLTVPPESEELIVYYITDFVTSGFAIENGGDFTIIKFYLPHDQVASRSLSRLTDLLRSKGLLGDLSVEEAVKVHSIAEIDWVRTYRQQFKPVEVGRVVVRPSWDETRYDDRIEIVIDPQMAFGTGHHETTKLCIEQLLELVTRGDRVLDVGVGSGILAILAAKLGAAECLGVDIDPTAVENAAENARLNRVDNIVSVLEGSTDKIERQNCYDIVVCNLVYPDIMDLHDDLVAASRPGAILILSGILYSQKRDYLEFLQSKGSGDIRVSQLEEWVCCLVIRS